MKKATLHQLFTLELQDLYDAEQQLIEAIPKMIDSATNQDLIDGLTKHLGETEDQVERLEQIGEECDIDVAAGAGCMGMEGVISEGEAVMETTFESEEVADEALISAAQRVEHYEMAGYGTAVELAKQMGHDNAAKLLQKTLDEEGNADKTLTKAAEKIYKQIED